MTKYGYIRTLISDVQASVDRMSCPRGIAPMQAKSFAPSTNVGHVCADKQTTFDGTAGILRDEPDWFNYPLTGYYPA
jgi:hypothetical protein